VQPSRPLARVGLRWNRVVEPRFSPVDQSAGERLREMLKNFFNFSNGTVMS
jgi:hypothetical protein